MIPNGIEPKDYFERPTCPIPGHCHECYRKLVENENIYCVECLITFADEWIDDNES